MLEVRNLSFCYSGAQQPVFEKLDFSLSQGEIVGLPGPSGRGKSTAAKLLSGYFKPDSGKVLLNDAPLPRQGFCPVQLLFQHPELAVNPRWKIRSILSEVDMPPDKLLAHLSISRKWMDRYPHELSGGELQRVCLARALGRDVRFLICDEMTSMLDALTQAVIWKAVLDIAAERNLGLLVISHDSALLNQLVHRTVEFFQKPECN